MQEHVRSLSEYDPDDVHCTDAAKIGFAQRETNEFTCAVRRLDGGCDWFEVQVDRGRRNVTVRLAERDAGCSLGFGD
ncbi:MAG: hypothetical protein ACRDNB_09535 [Gaiellaceae bacterium]